MDKILALTFLLLPQPIFAYIFWVATSFLVEKLAIEGTIKVGLIILTTTILYGVFAFLFARGFLQSNEAKKLGF